MKKKILILLLVTAGLPLLQTALHASIEENYKQRRDRFEEARQDFLAGKIKESADILREIMMDPASGLQDQALSARMLSELLRAQPSGQMLEECKKDFEKTTEEFKLVSPSDPNALLLGPLASYINDTLKYFEGKRPPLRDLKTFLPLDARKALELGRYADSLADENPVRSIEYQEALWAWISSQNLPELADPKSELSILAAKASGRINNSFWAKHRTYEREGTPEIKVLEEVLKKFSAAIQQKDEAALRALIHPSAQALVPEITKLGGAALEYRDLQLPQLSQDGQTVTLICTVKAAQAFQGMPAGEGPKVITFKKSENQWLIAAI